MRTIKLASVVLILAAVPALGDTLVAFELEMGGSNQGARCPEGGSFDFFAPGSTADNQTFGVGNPVTWAVRVAASGNHYVNGTWYNTPGVANFVFNLELHEGTAGGPLVSSATFSSSVNNGAGGCPLTSAAFAYTMDGWDAGPGRVIDLLVYGVGGTGGGARMDVNTYPTNPGDGTLLGMGAGYSRWNRTAGSYAEWSVAGVGRTGAPCDPTVGCLGVGPLCEGQITGLAEGTYTLVVVPGAGVNVLRGDPLKNSPYNLSVTQPAFAVAADATSDPDPITFIIGQVEECAGTLGQWRSVCYHTGPVNADLPIVLDPAATGTSVVTESRRYGIQKIEVDFTRTQGTAAPTWAGTVTAVRQADSAVYNATSQSVVDNGGGSYTLVAEWSGGVPNGCYKIDLTGKIAVCTVSGDKDCLVKCLAGSTNGDDYTNNIDQAQVRSENGKTAITAGAKFDVNLDGYVNNTDQSLVKSLNGSYASCP